MSGLRESTNGGGKILVVDDEPSIVDAVATALRYEGYEVDEGLERPRRARRRGGARARPDRARLDAPRPRRDRGRQAAPRAGLPHRDPLPDAKDSTENKVEALRAGGDDYVTKPFSLAEIVARIQAILRRSAGDLPGDVLRVGDSCSTRAVTRSSAARHRSS
jgi:two-component system OmpR family response regulator